ncbi:copper resistance CopC family protein [Ruicaihuangia caeni]|uniref:Copper resistance protein CopC n=1 Tax=Ruicaihuangia caeni TaxID=3042517 RepID=A0AAW6T1V5_9MICO|nr:copper resistance CopC family protein [Klugiella sp. YN-L-19]MDI2097805.1 copper resistance protein CopC [Klugiella sp. YN-L-19]
MSRLSRPLAVAAASAALLLLAAGPAAAHSTVVDSTPSEGEVLTTLPDQFSVTADEELLDLGGEGNGFAMVVQDAEGLYYGDGCATISGDTMTAPALLGEPGEYTLTYQLVSGDGHPLSGVIGFEWAPDGDFEASAGSQTAGACVGSNGDQADDQHGEQADQQDPAAEGDAAAPSTLPFFVAGGVALLFIAGGITFALVRRSASKR